MRYLPLILTCCVLFLASGICIACLAAHRADKQARRTPDHPLRRAMESKPSFFL